MIARTPIREPGGYVILPPMEAPQRTRRRRHALATDLAVVVCVAVIWSALCLVTPRWLDGGIVGLLTAFWLAERRARRGWR